MKVFEDYAYYYNLFYGDKDYRDEALNIDKMLKKINPHIKSILNMGCGTGRHDYELQKLGYTMHGIDLSADMIKVANSNLKNEKNLYFEVGDVRNYKPKKKYDAVLSLFHVMSYQNSNSDVLAALQTAYEALNKGGILLFDVWYGPGVLTDLPLTRIKEVEDEKNRLIRTAQPILHANENVVDVCYDVFVIDKKTGNTQEIKEKHCMRYFFTPELEYYLESIGFKLIQSWDCITYEKPDYNSWTAYFIAVKE